MAFTKATFDYLDSGGLINWITTAKTSAFTAVSGEGYLVDTSSAAVTVTLPTSPSAGDEIIIVDYASNAGTNNITLDPGTLNLRGATDDFVMSTNNQSVRLLYSGATKGWLVTSDAGAGAAAASTPDLTVDFLVIAGGGGGGGNSGGGNGGGGAGGLRTSYGSTSGGGSSAETSLSLDTATNYTVTIGAGAAVENSGSTSVFSTISSIGGGHGASTDSSVGATSGGSGGGDDYSNAGPGGGSGTSNQGYAGGSSTGVVSPYYGCGGGGAGGTGEANSGTYIAKGGEGLAVNIISTTNAGTASVGEVSGSDVYFASGGSGGTRDSSIVTSRIGGGGDGSNQSTNATAGAANTGGGGGGGTGGTSSGGGNGAAGGAGVVILRYPDAYTITVGAGITEASGSPFTEGSDKVSVFTAGTGTISFA